MGFGDVKPARKSDPLADKDRELREAMEASPGGDTRGRKDRDDVETPGSDAYLKRRQRDAEQDLRDAPRRR